MKKIESGLNMGLPPWALIENAVHTAETQGFLVVGAAACKEDNFHNFQGDEKTRYFS